jgi:tRNA pseudouridine13 synthase
VFNELLAARVRDQTWNRVGDGEVCMLQGSRSRFRCEVCDEHIVARCGRGDIHPGLPLWGRGRSEAGPDLLAAQLAQLAEHVVLCDFLEREGLDLAYRSTRLMADDFCWRFCDDGSLQLQFALGPGGYATVVLAELVRVFSKKEQERTRLNKGEAGSGNGSE